MMHWNAQGNAKSQAAVVAAGFSRATANAVVQMKGTLRGHTAR